MDTIRSQGSSRRRANVLTRIRFGRYKCRPLLEYGGCREMEDGGIGARSNELDRGDLLSGDYGLVIYSMDSGFGAAPKWLMTRIRSQR